jgi:hypothetical protein
LITERAPARYADTNPPKNKTRILQQDLMIFDAANASAMLDEFQKSILTKNSENSVALPLPDPALGEKSFAIKSFNAGSFRS